MGRFLRAGFFVGGHALSEGLVSDGMGQGGPARRRPASPVFRDADAHGEKPASEDDGEHAERAGYKERSDTADGDGQPHQHEKQSDRPADYGMHDAHHHTSRCVARRRRSIRRLLRGVGDDRGGLAALLRTYCTDDAARTDLAQRGHDWVITRQKGINPAAAAEATPYAWVHSTAQRDRPSGRRPMCTRQLPCLR